jgi:hypothetical protein
LRRSDRVWKIRALAVRMRFELDEDSVEVVRGLLEYTHEMFCNTLIQDCIPFFLLCWCVCFVHVTQALPHGLLCLRNLILFSRLDGQA